MTKLYTTTNGKSIRLDAKTIPKVSDSNGLERKKVFNLRGA